jgi:hypothetical protein
MAMSNPFAYPASMSASVRTAVMGLDIENRRKSGSPTPQSYPTVVFSTTCPCLAPITTAPGMSSPSTRA